MNARTSEILQAAKGQPQKPNQAGIPIDWENEAVNTVAIRRCDSGTLHDGKDTIGSEFRHYQE